MKYGRVVFGALTVGGVRLFGGAVFLGLLWLVMRRGNQKHLGAFGRMVRKDRWAVLVPAFVGMAWPFSMQPYLIGKYDNSAFFGMMVCLTPLITILVSVPMLGVWPKVRELIGVIGGLIGVWMLFGDAVERSISWLDFIWAVSVPLSYAVSNVFVKRRLGSVPSVLLAMSALGLGALVVLPIGLGGEVIEDASWGGISFALGCVVFLGVIGTGLSMWWFYVLIGARGPLFAGMVTYVVCSFAVFWGWVDGEAVTWRQMVALGVILGMTALVQWPSQKPRLRESVIA